MKKQLLLNFTSETETSIYQWLREKSYREHRPMAEIVRECLREQMIGENNSGLSDKNR